MAEGTPDTPNPPYVAWDEVRDVGEELTPEQVETLGALFAPGPEAAIDDLYERVYELERILVNTIAFVTGMPETPEKSRELRDALRELVEVVTNPADAGGPDPEEG